MSSCKKCGNSFEINDSHRELFQKMDVPAPEICPWCQFNQRLAFRNEWNFYKRKCNMCGEQMISLYSPDKPYKIYCSKCWWSDKFDPLEYGVDYDFNKPFFEQLKDLSLRVPKLSIQNSKSENCEYTNFSAENKNCYMAVGALQCEDCYFSYRIFYSKDIIDSFDLYKCEKCYECTQSRNLYNCYYSDLCENSSDLYMCSSCKGCKNCFGCINLDHKEYHIFNKKHEKEEYLKKIQELKKDLSKAREEYMDLKLKVPHRAAYILNCENCTGDQIVNCKNCYEGYTLKNSEDCSYFIYGDNNRDCFSINFSDNCELQYNSANLEKNYNVIGANLVWYCKNTHYCTLAFNSSDLFGCIGMKKHKHCILNKQYSKEDYEDLSAKIIKHLKDSGEWGEYYPVGLSPFGYNETIAQDFFPLEKSEALKEGYNWSDFTEEKPKVEKVISGNEVPANTSLVSDDILKWAIECAETGRLFRIIPQELKFYRENDVPLPRLHPEVRHRNRLHSINPFKTWDRKCQKCGADIKTSYSPERKEIIYCEECFLKEVY